MVHTKGAGVGVGGGVYNNIYDGDDVDDGVHGTYVSAYDSSSWSLMIWKLEPLIAQFTYSCIT
jgi:hypothetical protein